MAIFWVNYRIHNDQTSHLRYRALIDQIDTIDPKAWADGTSFVVLRTGLLLDQLVKTLSQHLDQKIDLLVAGVIGKSYVTYSGELDTPDRFRSLLPFGKKLM